MPLYRRNLFLVISPTPHCHVQVLEGSSAYAALCSVTLLWYWPVHGRLVSPSHRNMAAIPEKPALHPLTNYDRGALILIIAYSFVFITVIAASIRFGLAWRNRLHLKRDDFSFAAAVVSENLVACGVHC